MRTLILYGELGRRFGREHKFSVRNAAEAIQAMCVNYPGFKDYMRKAHKFGIGFKVFVGKSSLKRENESLLPSSNSDVIRIAPTVFGSGALAKTLIGAVLVVAGILLSPVPILGEALGPILIKTGALLVLGGLYQALSPVPDAPKSGGLTENNQSFIFSGPQNVTRQGGAVPVGYGRMMVGSTVISAGIEDSDQ